jgi:hypothetical protein
MTPRRWFTWPTTEPWNSDGRLDLDLHDGLEDHRLGAGVGLAEAHEGGGLERLLGRVDGVELAVVDDAAHADHGERR